MATPDRVDQAPPGTFKDLKSIDGKLGNERTKRLVRVMPIHHLHDEGYLLVLVRIKDSKERGLYTTYQFAIDPMDTVTRLSTTRHDRDRFNWGEDPTNPPSLDQVLRELSTARKVQRTLKNR